MTLIRNLGGYWLARYKGATYYTATRNASHAIAFALSMNGKPQLFA